jgi:hypothetical protein
MTRNQILAVACPRCQAAIGALCTELGRPVATHPMRVTQAELAAHWRAGASFLPRKTRQRWRDAKYRRRQH